MSYDRGGVGTGTGRFENGSGTGYRRDLLPVREWGNRFLRPGASHETDARNDGTNQTALPVSVHHAKRR